MMRTPYVEDWIERADQDLRTAALLLEEGSLPNPICFHAQQAGEKMLKGYLAAQGQNVRKTHALDDLVIAGERYDPSFAQLRDDAVYLKQFYIEARYPGDFPSFTLEEARKAYAAAKRIWEFVEERLEAGTKDAAA